MYIGTWITFWIFFPSVDRTLPYPRVPRDDCTRWMVSGCTPTTLHLSALRLEYDPGQPRPPRVNAVTWHPDVGFLDEWSAHSAGKWSFLVMVFVSKFQGSWLHCPGWFYINDPRWGSRYASRAKHKVERTDPESIERWGMHTLWCANVSVQGPCHFMISGSVP